jgi:uncharacterized protein (TIGR02001 family)
MLLHAASRAQVGGSVLLESDQRFRGVSLSGGRPAARLTVAYDHPGGGYAGASATGVAFDAGERRLALLGYLGYGGRMSNGLAWEAGGTYAHYAGDSRYDYGEAFAGLSGQRWSARLHHSPDYFGLGVRTVYAELGAGSPLGEAGRVFGHVGALVRLGGAPSTAGYDRAAPDGGRVRYDARLGGAWRLLRAGEVQLAWVGGSGGEGGFYPAAAGQGRSAVVLSTSYAF